MLPLRSSSLLFWFNLVTITYASYVDVPYPLEDQLPPVARVGIPFQWKISENTFFSSAGELLGYSTSSLPGWLSFNDTTLTFRGTPLQDDVGDSTVQLTAKDTSDFASSKFTLVVTDQPAPVLQHSVVEQFLLPNPSLSSVFAISKNSALHSRNPALRIPPGWSFSIGFQYDTFTGPGDNIYYAVSQADGSPLPEWMTFNPRSITINGYTPEQANSSAPLTVALALHGSDLEGYSASSLSFDIVIAAHELSLATSSLPTINITASSTFSISLNSPADFTGVLLDGHQIQPDDIVVLQVDTSYYPWLDYNTRSMALSGTPPNDADDLTLLPVTLSTTANQTIETNVSLAIVPSFFTASDLKPILVNPGQSVNFSLVPFYSNSTGVRSGSSSDVNLTASFDPEDASSFLSFDPGTGVLSGTVPSSTGSGGNVTHLSVSFTAYSPITHSTSHCTLPISLTASDFAHEQRKARSGLSPATRTKILLGLKISLSAIGGLLLVGLFLAGMRRLTRVQDTALTGEEGMKGWTDDEKKWYGIGVDDDEPPTGATGLASIRRAISRSLSSIRSPRSPRSPFAFEDVPTSPGVMKKAEFMGKIKRTAGRKVSNTVRVVGETCRRVVGSIGPSSGAGARKPVISKPVLVTHNSAPARAGAGTNTSTTSSPRRTSGAPFGELNLSQYAPSGLSLSIPGSPSSSTGGRSIPRRRADFVPPAQSDAGKSTLALTTPPQAYRSHRGSTIRRRSVDLESVVGSVGSRSALSVRSDPLAGAGMERTASVRSVRSTGDDTQSSYHRLSSKRTSVITRPRLVPFTSSSRVPVPKMPSSYFTGNGAHDEHGDEEGLDPDKPVTAGTDGKGAKTKRVASQMAKIFRSASTDRGLRGERGHAQAEKANPVDDLSVGIQYVNALGVDSTQFPGGSSFSLDSSTHGAGASTNGAPSISTKTQPVPRMLARTGEPFKFRVPLGLPHTSPTAPGSTTIPPLSDPLEVKLISGLPLPRFIRANMDVLSRRPSASAENKNSGVAGSRERERMVEFAGVPTKTDIGEWNVVVFMQSTEECVGRVVIEVVERAK